MLVKDNIIDGLSRELLLLVQPGQYDKALNIFNSRPFRQFEGVDKVLATYMNALLLRGYKNLKAGRNKEALKDGLTANQYPTNMILNQSDKARRNCEVYYFVGSVYEKMGDREKAREYFTNGTVIQPSALMTDAIFFQGLCLKNLEDPKRLINCSHCLWSVAMQELPPNR